MLDIDGENDYWCNYESLKRARDETIARLEALLVRRDELPAWVVALIEDILEEVL